MLTKDNVRFFGISSIIIITISFLTYFSTLNGFFTGPDFCEIYFGRTGKLINVLRLFIPIGRGDMLFIRPIADMLWLLDYRLWGLNPIGYRVTNLMMHSMDSILVFFLAFFLLHNKKAALAAGFLFAIHPIHSGAVSFIVGRTDPICSIFYLLSLISFALYILYNQRHRFFYLLSILFYPLAIFSKETAITLPLTIILYDSFVMKKFSLRLCIRRINLYIPYIAITVLYIVSRLIFTGRLGGYPDPITGGPGILNFKIIDYMSKVLYYIPTELFVPINPAVFSSASIQLITMTLVSGVLVAIVLSLKEILKQSRIILFAFLWMVVTLIPAHNLIGESNVLEGARLLYLPSAGFCIGLAFIIMAIKGKGIKRYLPLIIFTLVSIIYIFITIKNNSVWISAGEINRSITRIAKDYSKRYGVDIRCYFLIPGSTREGACVFANELPYTVDPLFAPLSPESVVILGDGHETDPAYRGNDFDLRRPDILQGLGKRIFFFYYNEDKKAFEDLSLSIKSNLLEYSHSFQGLEIPKLILSSSAVSSYISQLPNIPAYFIGGIEARIRYRKKRSQDMMIICWYRKDNGPELRRSFFLELDGEFHNYYIPFTIYRPDWTGNVFITKIELSFSNDLSQVDIEYVKLFPYQR